MSRQIGQESCEQGLIRLTQVRILYIVIGIMQYSIRGHGVMDKQLSTEELLVMLFKENEPGNFFRENEPAFLTLSFPEYLNTWCKKHLEVPEHVIRRANLDKSFGHQIFAGKRNPSRDTVLQLSFAMNSDYKQAQEMLRIAGKSQLYPRIKRDAAVIFCLNNHKSLVDTQIILNDLGLPMLGGKKNECG